MVRGRRLVSCGARSVREARPRKLDTNVLVYTVDTADPDRQQRALAALDDPGFDFVVSAQVLSEF